VVNRRKSTFNPKSYLKDDFNLKDELPSNKVDTTNCKIHNEEK